MTSPLVIPCCVSRSESSRFAKLAYFYICCCTLVVCLRDAHIPLSEFTYLDNYHILLKLSSVHKYG